MVDEAGPLAFFGGPGGVQSSAIEREMLEYAGGEVVLLPTGAAYERPNRVVERLAEHFAELGGNLRPVMVLNRRDAEAVEHADALRRARFVYLVGGSPLHLRSVLKDSAVLAALVAAWHDGAVVAGSSAGAMVLSDPMVDPRGGAFTVGLGLIRDVAVVPDFSGEITAGLRRTLALAPDGCAVVALGDTGSLLRESDGTWRAEGDAAVSIFDAGAPVGLESLAGKSLW